MQAYLEFWINFGLKDIITKGAYKVDKNKPSKYKNLVTIVQGILRLVRVIFSEKELKSIPYSHSKIWHSWINAQGHTAF